MNRTEGQVLRIHACVHATYISDSSTQTFPIEAHLPFSDLHFDSSSIAKKTTDFLAVLDFGTVLLGTTSIQSVTLENRGLGHVSWVAKSLNPDMFIVGADSGCLEGYKSHVSQNKVKVPIQFKPSSLGYTESTISFEDVLSGRNLQVRVYGQVSLDAAVTR